MIPGRGVGPPLDSAGAVGLGVLGDLARPPKLRDATKHQRPGAGYPLPPGTRHVCERKFCVVLALSFTLTLLRETFNFWTVDFIHTEGGRGVSNAVAAFLSTPFDVCGALALC